MSRYPVLTALVLASLGLVACSSQGDGTNPGDRVVIGGTSHVIWKTAGGGYGPAAG